MIERCLFGRCWCRKSAREGPTARIAANEESPITRALSQACKNRGGPIFLPMEGTIFSSNEEARDFFNLYSWEIGFGIRYGRSNKNNKGYTTRQDIVCLCEVCVYSPIIFFLFSFRDHILPFSIFYVVVNLYTTNWLVNSGRDHHVVRIVRL